VRRAPRIRAQSFAPCPTSESQSAGRIFRPAALIAPSSHRQL